MRCVPLEEDTVRDLTGLRAAVRWLPLAADREFWRYGPVSRGDRAVKEKELRIALVCFGGVSLAVYMHGISKEFLKLVRASSQLHGIKDRTARQAASHSGQPDADREFDTDPVFFDLLREITRRGCGLRVIVDIIAGASAGGINGAMLARALAHDLPMGPLRDLWLDNADVSGLLAPEAKARASSKFVLAPLVWLFGRTGPWEQVKETEVRSKLSLFLRSRWFKPPLSGPRMTELMYDAVTAMGLPRDAAATLLPPGLGLDLFVTVTDHYGYQQVVRIHDPPLIHEREHRHVLRFSYRRGAEGEPPRSDFDFDDAPALAFAARATSSFPGVFPPARIAEMDAFLAQRGVDWPRRQAFLERNFEDYLRLNVDPAAACYLDGSVLNNRPFRAAISAIRGRPAFREVDRRLVYIEPDPVPLGAPSHQAEPGFFATLKAALTDLPSAEPVADELNWVREFNDHVDRVRAIIDEARPQVTRLVAAVLDDRAEAALVPAVLRSWRDAANERVAEGAGFAYEGYVRLKLASVRASLAGLISRLRGVGPRSTLAAAIAAAVDAWAAASGTVYDNGHHHAVNLGAAPAGEMPRWLRFLLSFDVGYRRRRLQFLIEGQNRLYQTLDAPHFAGFDRAVVDRLKRRLYGHLEELAACEASERFGPRTRDRVEALFPVAPAPAELEKLEAYAWAFVEKHRARLDELMDALAAEIRLDETTDDLDDLLAGMDPGAWHPQARREVLTNYLGFPFWDVLTFPVMSARDIGEFNRILVDRISPQDARTLPEFSGRGRLKGTGFAHFAAFFSRAYRENDYLLGRIHALDRLVDIVCNAAGQHAPGKDWVLALKRRGFTAILDTEERHLPHSADLIAGLRRSIAGLGQDAVVGGR
jgi:patatin-related protein